MVFSRSSTYQSNARKSVDFANQDGGLLRTNDAAKDPSARKDGMRFDDNDEQAKKKDEENKNYNEPTVAEDNNANIESLDASPTRPRVSLPSEQEELKKTGTGDVDALLTDESFNSAL